MPNIKSAIKRVQLSKLQNAKNTAARSSLRTAIRRFEEVVNNNPENAVEALQKASRALDKAAAKGLIHKNKAARKKSRMAKKFQALNNKAS
ncbi:MULTISPECIES: 30S ribosomal protein S20 [Dehalobacter]|jgi:small subunit ribosomal protein S20|uniref:Small ribosomal subunit protein bS20 n=2 Tax=Dehalobacter restrictus TaxID=55583 RepID=A0A857DHF0_9FIRM|nr:MULTISPECIES: 30S ribosomal protein S20 [Dehalobacter]AHF09188.1 30S ribosomal protein S20 [Dehalobacter restrictus DSM 9455]MCG1025810.1 30S ribosomal protein S20 [Dehalobacter sp.]MDJ0306472.1 30S ribosomal protein S20 [Dehalobacter sp.]OCZ51307.1 30S ribosomal protein S20 [Dehalobacter sp. TeCB1]QGZ99724.1 30S ribosomal protein S20 [Dehalobacter restrictus]